MAGFNAISTRATILCCARGLAYAMPETFRWLLKHGVAVLYGPLPEPPRKTAHAQCAAQFGVPSSPISNAPAASPGGNQNFHPRHFAVVDGRRWSDLWRENPAIPMPRAAIWRPARRGCWRTATSPTIPSSKPNSWARSNPRSPASVNATGDGRKLALSRGARILHGDPLRLGLGNCARAARQTNWWLRLPPVPILANVDAFPLELMPSFLLPVLDELLSPRPGACARSVAQVSLLCQSGAANGC